MTQEQVLSRGAGCVGHVQPRRPEAGSTLVDALLGGKVGNNVEQQLGLDQAVRAPPGGEVDTGRWGCAALPQGVLEQADRIVARRFAATTLILGGMRQILHVDAPTSVFLRVPSHCHNQDVHSLLKGGLHAAVSAVLDAVQQTGVVASSQAAVVRMGKHFRRVAVDAMPLDAKGDGAGAAGAEARLLLVLRDLGRIEGEADATPTLDLARRLEEDMVLVKAGFEREVFDLRQIIVDQAGRIRTQVRQLKLGRARERRQLKQTENAEAALTASRLHVQALVDGAELRSGLVRSLMSAVAMTEMRERKSLAQELHDDLAQVLSVIRIKVDALLERRLRATERLLCRECQTLLVHANRALRSIMSRLSPPALEQGGLMGGLDMIQQELARNFGLAVMLEQQSDFVDPPEPARSVLFRAVRELLINVAKHAHTEMAWVRIGRLQDNTTVHIEVLDSGCGFDVEAVLARPADELGGFGLHEIMERLEFVGASCEILSRSGHGTRVELCYCPPLSADEGLDPGG